MLPTDHHIEQLLPDLRDRTVRDFVREEYLGIRVHMAVLLTGGLGFIGSHTAVELLQAGYDVVIVDDLRNSDAGVLSQIKQIAGDGAHVTHYEADVLDPVALDLVMGTHRIESVIHFAASKSVSESIDTPLQYYRNNVVGLIGLLEACRKHGIRKFIFSSSATVYGDAHGSPLTEDLETGRGITNPYGRTKHMCEQILQDACHGVKSRTQAICLRYFNPVGAHPSGVLGEDPVGIPSNIMAYIVRTAVHNNTNTRLGEEYAELRVFGDDYGTAGGRTTSVKLTVACHPSSSFALDGSLKSHSTSAGR